MNDEEWKRWASTYAREQRPMPRVLGRARTDRKRAILGFTVLYALAALLAPRYVRELSAAHGWVAIASSLFMLLFLLAIIVGAHVTMRGTFAPAAGAPLDLLAALERRHAGRRRLMRFMPWLTGVGVCGVIATAAAETLAAGRFDLWSAAATLATCGVTVGFVGLTIKRVGTLIERELREAAEARRLLQEEAEEEGEPS